MVLERLGFRKRQPTTPEKPAEVIVMQKAPEVSSMPEKPQRPDTILAVLTKIEELACKERSQNRISEELALLGGDLLRINKDFLGIAQERATKRGKDWPCDMTVSPYFNEQDGLSWSGSDSVKVGEKIEIISAGIEATQTRSEQTMIRSVMARDESSVERVEWKQWEEVSGKGKTLTFGAEVALENNKVISARIEHNNGMIVHEIHLPANSI